MARKFSKIALPEFNQPTQMSLLAGQTPQSARDLYRPFPKVNRDLDSVWKVITDCQASSPGLVGLDMEYDTERQNKPSIFGLSGLNYALSVPWSEECVGAIQTCIDRGLKLVAYSTMSADKPCVDPYIHTRREDWIDAMLTHYLAHQDLTKRPGKDEDDDPGALGFMNLWTAYSLVGDAPNWKRCRGLDCFGPCPSHSVFDYNAIDSWAGLVVEMENDKMLRSMGVPSGFRAEMLELSELCEEMRVQGVHVDREYVTALDTELKVRKSALFKDDQPFNPKSPKVVVGFFRDAARRLKIPELGIEKNTKEEVKEAVLVLAARRRIFSDDKPDIALAALRDEDLSSEESLLLDLYEHKGGGKGPKSWFDARYFGRDGLLHPRTILTGTSNGRLSQASPNLMNLFKKGPQKRFRGAVIARPGFRILRADVKQLEFRMVAYQAGIDPKDLPHDAFDFLVEKSQGGFSRAAAMTGIVEREVAKVVVHAGDLLEGFTVLTGDELESSGTKRAVEAGALRVHYDWEYAGGVVAFTGVNLAKRLFGSKDFEARKKAHEIQDDMYFANFPMIRRWQRGVTAEVEARGYVKYPTGRFLRLSGSNWDEESRPQAMVDDAKVAASAKMSGVSADHVQAVMLRFRRERGRQGIPLLQVHDELLFETPLEWSREKNADFIRLMTEETWRLPGFSAPVDAGLGASWLEAMQAADDPLRRLDV